jgi:hypothetical protein
MFAPKKHSLLPPSNAQSPDKPKKMLKKQNPKEKKHTEISRRSTAISLTTEAANKQKPQINEDAKKKKKRARDATKTEETVSWNPPYA